MDFSELQTEFYARGFDFLDQDAAGRIRAKQWINEAYLEDICSDQPWDFLRTSASGVTPLTIADVDTIISVRDTTRKEQLRVSEMGWLEDTFGDLTRPNRPEYVYFTSSTTLASYPVDTGSTIQVRYFKVPAELDADADEPLFGARWHGLIIDFAIVRAYVDTDNFEAAQFIEARAQKRLDRMRSSEMSRSPHPLLVQSTEGC